MGLGKWLDSLFSPTPRSRDKSHQKAYAKKEKNRDPIRLSKLERSMSPISSAEPTEAEPIETNYTEVFREPHPVELPPEIAAGLSRTSNEIMALQQTALLRGAAMQQQRAEEMTQAQAIAHSMNLEMAMLTGMGRDPLQGLASTPYWKQMYGELGQSLGPFYPYGGTPYPRSGK